MPVVTALARCEPLARLGQRLRDSTARLESIRPLLPTALAPHVRAGPLDEGGWTLLADNAAVAAKLRQLAPQIEQRLAERGWGAGALRLKIQGSHGGR